MKVIPLMLSALLLTGMVNNVYAETPKTNQATKKSSTRPAKLIAQPDQIAGLKFGQTMNKQTLNKAGFSYPSDANSDCYYVGIDKRTAKPKPNLLIVYHNKLGLVEINRQGIDVFSKIKINDSVSKVLQAHQGKPTYYVDKYDDGDSKSYHLVYDLGNGNQIDYRMFGGKKMPHDEVASKDWRDDYAKQLTGKVYSIAVGQKESIALAEGCS